MRPPLRAAAPVVAPPQAVSQVISVFASAIGPLLIAEFRVGFGSIGTLFLVPAAISALLAVARCLVKLPVRPLAENLSAVPG